MTKHIRVSVLGVAVALNVAALATLHVAMVRGAERAAVAEQAVERIVITASRYQPETLATCPAEPAAI
jgi:hypothetical protein